MTFRISKYTYNSWKIASDDKNIFFKYKTNPFKFSSFAVIFLLCYANIAIGFIFYRNIITDNNLNAKQV